MSKVVDVEILYRPHLDTTWLYPKNVNLNPSGRQMDIKMQEESNIIKKALFFLKFLWQLRCILINKKPHVVVLYDSIPLFAYYLIHLFIGYKPFTWYHNHDVSEIYKTRKYSIGWFASKFESKMFPNLDLFTLPAIERKSHFPMNRLKGQFFFLPNLPYKNFYSQFTKLPKTQNDPLRLIYQGSISEGHGLENIISILFHIVGDRKMELHLAGRISAQYRLQLLEIAKLHNVLPQVFFHGIIPYLHLPALTITCDIGIAIHEPREIIYRTGGTASNKIYEYAACGLPILYYDNEHYNHHLNKYEWAISTNLEPDSLKLGIKHIVDHTTGHF